MTVLVIPLVSTGNVPQLSTDLILHTLSNEFQFVQAVDSTFVHPFVGPLDYVFGQDDPELYKNVPHKQYSTGLELFHNESKDLYVLQQRSPVIQGYLNNFIKRSIVPLLNKYGIDEVVIVDSYGALDEDVLVPSSIATRNGNPFSLGVIDLNSIGDMSRVFDTSLNLGENSNQTSNIASTLFTFTEQSLQQEISTRQEVFKFVYHLLNSQLNSLKTIKYCSLFVHEGDNSYDASVLCEYLPQAIDKLNKLENLQAPVSWKGVYGQNPIRTAFDEGIYM
ncbi:hypothetical protein Kpol_1018p181 [Vanderwaltozyma polyspora DSM 70294]|uniref:Proteasome assembly chaperone 2 n=1 Tax=Vanderwaltozyma polyspora (strain ATCC 22028 / DSM 70294 / BCRC 21397 / CBS 2163 / NBRC 10782 / NRRL Y-8283 / UCD 57-17) TaxID=436907 RepID=A7TE21_VANPO|nr:uncharacterized protein Kpol_1018p181 [Vanderwaltozyma polyspora DSM 70294]EDO19641.1 hypothetical protein Kpol_1018p181 [Vanderwaltozyma polyspora DSM 70294]